MAFSVLLLEPESYVDSSSLPPVTYPTALPKSRPACRKRPEPQRRHRSRGTFAQPSLYFLRFLQALTSSLEQTLTAFLGGVLSKRYTNPSSDVITVLAGLNDVDYLISEFVNAIDGILKNGRTCKLAFLCFQDVVGAIRASADGCQWNSGNLLCRLRSPWSAELIKRAWSPISRTRICFLR